MLGSNSKAVLLLLTVSAAALWSAPAASADDPSTAPTVDQNAYTIPDDPDWVFFRTKGGEGCGISKDGTVGCDIVVPRNPDGSVMQWGQPGPPGSYSCNQPGTNYYCPLPPPGTNQVIAGPETFARYATSDKPTFTREAKVLPDGYRLVNRNAWCYVSGASPGGITCKTGSNGFQWSPAGGILRGLF